MLLIFNNYLNSFFSFFVPGIEMILVQVNLQLKNSAVHVNNVSKSRVLKSTDKSVEHHVILYDDLTNRDSKMSGMVKT